MVAVEVALRQAAASLAEAGIPDPRREARLIVTHLLGQPANSVPDPAATIDRDGFHALLTRRAAREPWALITGRQGFWTLDLDVTRDTLIPRADSETLIEAAIAAFPRPSDVQTVLDLGTGTGCLLLAALTVFTSAWGLGVDRAPAAAALAARNAHANALAGRASLIAGSWAEAIGPATFDLILSNPPYIEAAAIAALMPEVSAWEPRTALDGGADGLSAYAALLPQAARLLNPAGVLILELGQGQRSSIRALAAASGLAETACRNDLAGTPRAMVLQAKKPFGSTGVGS